MERKSLLLLPNGEAAIKAISEGNGSIEGYGAIKGNRDSYGDVIRDGAFRNLEKLVKDGFLGDGHDWSKPVGFFEEVREDEQGLYIKATFHGTPDAQAIRAKVAERMAAGKSVGLSIGYFTKEASYGTADGEEVRYLDGIEVFEVSVVTMPANDQAKVLAAKGHSEPRAKQFENLTAQVQDYVQRLQEIKEAGANDERLAKFREELSAVAALCLEAIGDLEAKTAESESFDSFPDGWDALRLEAMQLIN